MEMEIINLASVVSQSATAQPQALAAILGYTFVILASPAPY